MLLRRVIEHVKTQNWVAVGLDLSVVVLGVFIGFQVDRLYETARERTERAMYLDRLLDDALLSISSSEEARQFISQATADLTLVHESLLACDLAKDDQDRFAMGLFHFGKVSSAQFIRGTLDEITSSGKIGLIRSIPLRNILNRTAQEIERQEQIWPAIHGKRNAHSVYVERQYMFHMSKPVGGRGSVTWNELRVDFTALCSDVEFQSSISRVLQLHHISVDWMDQNLSNFYQLKAQLDKELH